MSGRASAKSGVQGELGFSAGWNDNIFATPNTPNSGATPPESDFFFRVRPGIIVTTGSPRAVERWSDVFSADLFVSRGEADSYSDRLDWVGVFQPSARSELFLNAESTVGRLSTFNTLLASPGVTATPLPSGATTFFDAAMSEAFLWMIAPVWRFNETGNFRVFVPIDPRALPTNWDGALTLGFERLFKVDGMGVDAREEYVQYDAAAGSATTTQRQLINTLLGRWRRDWTPLINSQLAFGAVEAMQPNGKDRLWAPTGEASVHYRDRRLDGELLYRHLIEPNAFVGSTFLADEVTLRGMLPLGRKTHLAFGTAASYQRAREVDTAGRLSGALDLVIVDGTLSWAPLRELSLFARYQFFDQMSETSAVPSFKRNEVLLGIATIYPGQAVFPVRGQPATRLDRADNPGIIEPHLPPVDPPDH